MLHRTHMNGDGFAEDSVNNASKPGRCGAGRSRSPVGCKRSVMPDKMAKHEGMMKRDSMRKDDGIKLSRRFVFAQVRLAQRRAWI